MVLHGIAYIRQMLALKYFIIYHFQELISLNLEYCSHVGCVCFIFPSSAFPFEFPNEKADVLVMLIFFADTPSSRSPLLYQHRADHKIFERQSGASSGKKHQADVRHRGGAGLYHLSLTSLYGVCNHCHLY